MTDDTCSVHDWPQYGRTVLSSTCTSEREREKRKEREKGIDRGKESKKDTHNPCVRVRRIS